jgi:hypothetical protein
VAEKAKRRLLGGALRSPPFNLLEVTMIRPLHSNIQSFATDESIAAYSHRAIASADRNGNGVVEVSFEARTFRDHNQFHGWGKPPTWVRTTQDLSARFEAADANGDKLVDAAEFAKLVEHYDSNRDGRIDRTESSALWADYPIQVTTRPL